MPSAAARAEEQLRDLPVDPIWVGVIVLGLFLVLMAALLVFGKGRPHT